MLVGDLGELWSGKETMVDIGDAGCCPQGWVVVIWSAAADVVIVTVWVAGICMVDDMAQRDLELMPGHQKPR